MLEEKVTRINLDDTKLGKIRLHIDDMYMQLFRETANTDRNKPLTRELMKAFLRDYDTMDSEMHSLMMSHALFYASANRMKELMDTYALNEITDKVFPQQLEAFRALLKLVETLGSYYKEVK